MHLWVRMVLKKDIPVHRISMQKKSNKNNDLCMKS